MMYLIINIWWGLLSCGPYFSQSSNVAQSSSGSSVAFSSTPKELCKLRGSVYVTDDPQKAHYYVYVEDHESAANLSVFVEENKLFTDQPGHWFYTDIQAFADFVVYFTDNKGMADFTIYYTDVSSFAGCRN